MTTVSMPTSNAPLHDSQPSLEANGAKWAAQKDGATLPPLTADPYAAEYEIVPSWVAESRSSAKVAAYVVIASALTTITAGAFVISMLLR